MAPHQGEQDEIVGKENLLDAVGAVFARLRRRTVEIDVGPAVSRKDQTRMLVVSLVEQSADEVTVGAVADRLGVDPSAASRMVSDCISAGVLARSASQQDARRTVLVLTPAGAELRDRFRLKYRRTFEHITRDWPRRDQLELIRLLLRYVDDADAAQPAGRRREIDRGG